MTYDTFGRQITVTDALGKTTTYTYDEMDRIREVKDPVDGITRYTYDLRGNLRFVTDAKNHIIRYEYDERDRIKKMTDQLGREEINNRGTEEAIDCTWFTCYSKLLSLEVKDETKYNLKT